MLIVLVHWASWSKWNGDTHTLNPDLFLPRRFLQIATLGDSIKLSQFDFVCNGVSSNIAGGSHFLSSMEVSKVFTADWHYFLGNLAQGKKNLWSVQRVKSRHFKFFFNHHPLLCRFGKMQEFCCHSHSHWCWHYTDGITSLFSLTYRYNRYSGNERLKCLGKFDSWMNIYYTAEYSFLHRRGDTHSF